MGADHPGNSFETDSQDSPTLETQTCPAAKSCTAYGQSSCYQFSCVTAVRLVQPCLRAGTMYAGSAAHAFCPKASLACIQDNYINLLRLGSAGCALPITADATTTFFQLRANNYITYLYLFHMQVNSNQSAESTEKPDSVDTGLYLGTPGKKSAFLSMLLQGFPLCLETHHPGRSGSAQSDLLQGNQLQQGVGPDDLQRFLPSPTIL